MEKAAKAGGDLIGSLERRNPSVQARASDANELIEVHNMNTTVKTAVNQETPTNHADLDARIGRLESSVVDMYEFSSSGFEKIEAVAKLALKAMENPETYNHIDNIGMVLETIWGLAEQARMCVETEIADAGLDQSTEKETASLRRFMASVAAKQGVAA